MLRPFSLSTAEEASDPNQDITCWRVLRQLSSAYLSSIKLLALQQITCTLKCLVLACQLTVPFPFSVSSSKFSRSILGSSWSAACATSLVLVPLNVELGHILLSVKKSSVHPAGASVMLRIEERGVVEFSAGMH
jgi:hypothetical protein